MAKEFWELHTFEGQRRRPRTTEDPNLSRFCPLFKNLAAARLGDAANVTARLADLARKGEILLGDASLRAADLPADGLEPRSLELKGRAEPIPGWSLTHRAPRAAPKG